MGQFLACGVATCISIIKNGYSTERILEDLKLKMNLDIFNVVDDEKVMCLEIKKDIFENNILDFIREQITPVRGHFLNKELEYLDEFEGKSFEEMIRYSKENNSKAFFYSEGYLKVTNIVSYIFTNVRCDASIDMVSYISDGKIIMECWFELFCYLRDRIAKSTNNPLKDAVFVVIDG